MTTPLETNGPVSSPPTWNDSFKTIKSFIAAQEEIDPVNGLNIPLSQAAAESFRSKLPRVEEKRGVNILERLKDVRQTVLQLVPEGEDIDSLSGELFHTLWFTDEHENNYFISIEDNGGDWIDVDIEKTGERISLNREDDEGGPKLNLALTFDTIMSPRNEVTGNRQRARYKSMVSPLDMVEAECRLFEGVLTEVEKALVLFNRRYPCD